MHSLVVAELAGMYARTGRQQELANLLETEQKSVFADNAKVQVDRAREGLAIMKSQPGIAFRCGTYALANVARKIKKPVPGDFMEINPSSNEGFSLVQLQNIAAEQLQLTSTVIEREVGSGIPVPSIIHLRCGHYGALLEESNGQFLLSDPTFGSDVWITRQAIEDEASGYFLVPGASPQTSGHAIVSPDQAAKVFGKGYVTAIDPKATKKCDLQNGKCPDPGMAGYRFHIMAASLSVTDTPLVVPTAYGPGLSLNVTYNQREANQAGTNLFTHFGPQWVCGVVSWLEDNTSNVSANITLYLPGGGSEVHSSFTSTGVNQGYYAKERESGSRLYRIGAGHYERRHMDGSKFVYQRAIGSTGTARKVFLSQAVDSWGNAQNFSYDSVYTSRVNSVTAASGKTLYFFYANGTDPYLVTSAADDANPSLTNRKAVFGYQVVASKQRLVSITDPVGIVSSFAYDATGFMTSLTTPYGTSKFSTGGGEENLLRWLEAKDPQGDVERVEFHSNVDPSTISASPLPSGAGVSTAPQYRQYRNTFYWDKKAWIMAPGDRSKAHLYHWLHSQDGTGAFGVLEMEKPAYGNNVWYNYVGQPNSYYPGPSGSPSAISRAIEGPDGTTESAIQLAEHHALTGNLTQSTDSLGRVTRYTYDVTGYDLQAVEIQDGVTWHQISGLSGYINHKPQTLTDAAGQTTTLTYTTEGQIATQTNALNETTTFTYETNPAANGYRMVKLITGAQPGATVGYTYDSYDRIRTATDSSGYVVTYDYDAMDRVTLITFPDATTVQYVYDRLDLFANKDRENRWTRTWHNSLRQPVLTADALGRLLQMEWCRCGALQKLIDGKGNLTRWQYDEQGRNIARFSPDGKTKQFSYEPLSGRLSSITDSKSQVKTYSYFLDGALKSLAYTNTAIATPTASFTFDTIFPNRVLTMTDGNGTTSYGYHAVGTLGALQVASENGPLTGNTDLIAYSYDELARSIGRNIGPIGTENTSSWDFDVLGRMTGETNNLGAFVYAYVNQTSRLDYVGYPNGQKTTFDYYTSTGDFRLKTLHHLADGADVNSTLSKLEHAYTPAGNLTSLKRQFGQGAASKFHFGHDAIDQLVSATLADEADPSQVFKRHSYHYDLAGNRDSVQNDGLVVQATNNARNQLTELSGGGKLLVEGRTDEAAKVEVNGVPATVDSSNRYRAWVNVVPGANTVTVEAEDYAPVPNSISKQWVVNVTSIAARSFTYDDNGNTLDDGVKTYTWDAENRLVKIAYATGFSTEIQYDGQSRRTKIVEKDDSNAITQTRQFIWSGFEVCEERDATNGVVRRFYGNGEQAGAALLYYTRDHLGSIREVVDSSAKLRQQFDYDPYGKAQRVGEFKLGEPGTGPVLQAASSRQTHGAIGSFDRVLNLTGAPTTESRGSSSTTIMLSFDSTISTISSVELNGVVVGSGTISGNEVTVGISGMDNERTNTLRLFGVSGGAGTTDEISLSFARLDGDVNSDGRITEEDLTACGNFITQPTNAVNCHADVNRDGTITLADILLIRSKLHQSLFVDRLFTGHFWHLDSGLHLAPFRAYDAAFGSWLSEDPIQELGGLNLYAYVGNRPTGAIDPLGHDLLVVGTPTLYGMGQHAFAWSTKAKSGAGMHGSRGDGWKCMTPDGVKYRPDGKPALTHVVKVDDLNGMTEEEAIAKIASWPGWNHGIWVPWVNDCHNQLKEAFDYAGIPFPTGGVPEGRIPPKPNAPKMPGVNLPHALRPGR